MFKKNHALVLTVLCLLHLSAGPAALAQNPAAVLRPDPTNKQYFYYANKTQAMVGTSGSYLPHVNQNNASFNRNNTYCTLANFRPCVDEIRSKGLNKIRLWVGLNHSPGTPQNATAPGPYPGEQPFVFNGSQWDLALFDDTNNPDANDLNDGFFANLRKVIAYCQVAPVVFVEVTLFDPWLGTWTLGPWHGSRNTWGATFRNPSTGAADRRYFLALDNPNFNPNLPANDTTNKTDLNDDNRRLRKRQVALMKRLVDEIWDLRNFYWEMANEADYNTGVPLEGMLLWHRYMMKELYDYETTKGQHHMMAVNFSTDAALDRIKTTPPAAPLLPYLDIVNTHYVHLWTGTNSNVSRPGYNGSIAVVRKYNVWTGTLDKVYGFNESRITGIFPPPAAGDLPFGATADATRVGAWEFMANEGGLIDHLNYDWLSPSRLHPESVNANLYLGMLNKFLRTLPLATMQKKLSPIWVSGWPTAYPARDTNVVRKYFGTMSSGESVHILYLHYSRVSGHAYAMYVPDMATQRTEDLTLTALGAAGTFKYEWFDPRNIRYKAGSTTELQPEAEGTFSWGNLPGEIVPNVRSQAFRGDAVLRVTRLSTNIT